MFDLLTHYTITNEGLEILEHIRPLEVRLKAMQSLLNSKMAADRCRMILMQ